MKIKNILLATCGLLIINSCTKDDITVQPDGRQLVQTFYKTDQQMIEALNGAYDPLQHCIWGGSTFMWGSIASDDAVGGGENTSDQRGYQVADLYIVTAVEDDEQDLQDYYILWWEMNTRCNAIIQYADPTSQLGSKAVANAYFLKGLAYFELTRMFGGLPIIDEVPGIESKYPRATQADTWAAIERYLNAAIDLTVGGLGLDARTGFSEPSSGYATLASAQMLLGKVYLYQSKYTEAETILEKVVASGNYKLEDVYANVFYPGNKHGVESVFEINFTALGAQSWDGNLNNGNALATLVSPRAFTNNIQNFPDHVHSSGWGMNQPTKKLAKAFDDMGDTVRKYVTMISTDTLQYMCDTAHVVTAWQNSITGWWDNKHCRKQGFDVSATNVNQNTVLMRYSDLLLMLAEAYNKTGDDTKAKTYLNMIRTRAKLSDITSSGTTLLADIKKERQLELCLEGDRYFDLVRWGDAATELTGEGYDHTSLTYADPGGRPGVTTNGLFPIPYNEIARQGDYAGFPQNPGY